jgi:hexokinase
MSENVISNTMNSINPIWESFKKELDKYPNAFQLKFDKEKGHILFIDFDVVIQLQENPNS